MKVWCPAVASAADSANKMIHAKRPIEPSFHDDIYHNAYAMVGGLLKNASIHD